MLSKQKAMESVVDALSPEAAAKRKVLAEEIAEKALRNPRSLPKRKQGAYAPAFGYRVVRRHDKNGCQWLEVCDVLYDKGKPMSFGLAPATLTAQQTNSIMDLDDAGALSLLRQKHEMILAAFTQPILDEKTDFGQILIRP